MKDIVLKLTLDPLFLTGYSVGLPPLKPLA